MAMAKPAAAAALGVGGAAGSRDVSFRAAVRQQATAVELSRVKVGWKVKISCQSPAVRSCAGPTTTTATTTTTLPQQSLKSGDNVESQRAVVRLGLPSKGRMAEGTLSLLKECSLPVRKLNPRQYIADIPGLPNLEVWFQRESDVVRKLRSGDLDMGIVGYDVVAEFGEDDEDIVLVHDALQFGECHLGIAVPTYGIFESITSLSELAAMTQWTEERPLRIVTGFTYLGAKFLREKGIKHVSISTADGALEAAPAMGTADAILDLVSSGTTLRENNLKELSGGKVITSQGVFVASRRALIGRSTVLDSARELLERFEAHLRARNQFSVVANMRGSSHKEVADKLLMLTDFHGLQGPTVAPVYNGMNGTAKLEYFAIVIIVEKTQIYNAVRQLRAAGGSGVLVSPLTYIFDEEPPRWRKLLKELKMSD